jgi:N-acetyl-alpha-D-muramate 1-phosphate uridylyltransferase
LQAVILAGGLGTRLGERTSRLPKPMMSVAGKPFLEHQIRLLRREGVRDLVLSVGYLGRVIERHFRDGQEFGVRIRYVRDGQRLLGPAGALRRAAPLLGDPFLVIYGDAYLRMDYGGIMRRLLGSGALGVMAVYRNENRYGRSDIEVEGGRVTRYDKAARGLYWINYGVSALRKKALEMIPPGRPYGEEEFYGKLIARRQLLAYPVRTRFYEIGTPAALEEFSAFLSRGWARGAPSS